MPEETLARAGQKGTQKIRREIKDAALSRA